MSKLKKIYKKNSRSQTGFTLIEVLVAMLIAFFFVLGTMQALVLATAFRVKAQEKQRANQLIQEDIEQVQRTAREFDAIDHSKCGVTAYSGSYAEALASNLPVEPLPRQLLNNQGKTYELERQIDTNNSTAKVLKINYAVRKQNEEDLNLSLIAIDYIEVIPDVAIQCP